MRRIESEDERERKVKRRNIYLTIFMLLILLISTAGYAFFSGNRTTSNEIEEVHSVNINGQSFYMTNSKNDVKNISVNINAGLSFYSGNNVYVASDSQQVSYEIFSTIGAYASHIQNACYGNCTENLPEKTCSDKLIVWSLSTENNVYQRENCIFIEGDLKAVDAFIYKIFE